LPCELTPFAHDLQAARQRFLPSAEGRVQVWKVGVVILEFSSHRSKRARERPVDDTVTLQHLVSPPPQARPGIRVMYRRLRRQDQLDLTVDDCPDEVGSVVE
jgi:hypothetical protein